mmetsp:Transcript_7405/g.17047  ORF Transcript_7405/g.17047 Transcript_7405/m.17047 type:complete len:274 (-) Transcript_7405:1179-2000(-)
MNSQGPNAAAWASVPSHESLSKSQGSVSKIRCTSSTFEAIDSGSSTESPTFPLSFAVPTSDGADAAAEVERISSTSSLSLEDRNSAGEVAFCLAPFTTSFAWSTPISLFNDSRMRLIWFREPVLPASWRIRKLIKGSSCFGSLGIPATFSRYTRISDDEMYTTQLCSNCVDRFPRSLSRSMPFHQLNNVNAFLPLEATAITRSVLDPGSISTSSRSDSSKALHDKVSSRLPLVDLPSSLFPELSSRTSRGWHAIKHKERSRRLSKTGDGQFED